jgi:tripartite-type tricarboxylate transporter receptor subunit TctC
LLARTDETSRPGSISSTRLTQDFAPGTVIVENRPGAGSIIASEQVARIAPDSNTLLVIGTSFLTNPHLHKVSYDPLAFEPTGSSLARPR